MRNDYNSLSHTKWRCQYHIVLTPKYRRQVIYHILLWEHTFIIGLPYLLIVARRMY